MNARAIFRRLVPVLAILLAIVGIARSQAPEPSPANRVALLAAIEGPIGPATVRHVEKMVDRAIEREAALLILRIDTPGGLATSMREVISQILRSPVPVAGYVAPPGAHAASAGTYILYATHVAAMAPGTNLGAATPVQIGGGFPGGPSPREKEGKDGDKGGQKGDGKKADSPSGGNGEGEKSGKESGDEVQKPPPAPPGDAMARKATNDAVAFIRSLADMHGRNADWAEKAVREAASLSANRALEMKVIDHVAPDVRALLQQMDGRKVTAGSAEITLATKDLTVERVEADFITEALGILSNPNVAFLLMIIGVYGLIFEFSNPGSIGPGVAGVICLVLALYALNQLPLNYAGLALVLFGLAFMVAEAFTPTFGALGAGGLAAFVIGSAMLVDTESPQYQLSWWVIGVTAAASGAFLIFLVGYMWRAYRRPGAIDGTRMIGAEGQVLNWSGTEGHVWAEGERWIAQSDVPLEENDTVRVRALDGLVLHVDRAENGEAAADTERRAEKGD